MNVDTIREFVKKSLAEFYRRLKLDKNIANPEIIDIRYDSERSYQVNLNNQWQYLADENVYFTTSNNEPVIQFTINGFTNFSLICKVESDDMSKFVVSELDQIPTFSDDNLYSNSSSTNKYTYNINNLKCFTINFNNIDKEEHTITCKFYNSDSSESYCSLQVANYNQ